MGRRALTTQEFIAKARAVHGARYDYSKVVYAGAHVNVILSCYVHGEFRPRPTNHLQGTGCPTCGLRSSDKPAVVPIPYKPGAKPPFGGMAALPFWSKK
jgi:hypothetical protein